MYACSVRRNPPLIRSIALTAPLAVLLCATGCPFLTPPVVCTSDEPVGSIGLKRVADGFTAPVGMAVPDDGTRRLFIVDQVGRIYIVTASGQRLMTPFLDVTDRMPEIGIDFGNNIIFDERGLLGLDFHPDYRNNGRFYVFYTVPKRDTDDEEFDSRSRISEFRVSSGDPNVADPASERVLLEILSPQFNHNGGQLKFGPDGYLYIGVGDGGASNDDGFGHHPELGNGQYKMTLHGKLLRIDVDDGEPYGIPADNPFVNDPDALPEIYAYGLRNPWRFSWDAQGRLFLADVGQNLYEEINIIERGGNYGWRIREGFHCFDNDNPNDPPASCPTTGADGEPLLDPILEYPHDADEHPFGISVTGGYVYRGTAIPCLRGEYVFGDWSTNFLTPDGTIFAAAEADDGTWTMRELSVAGADDGRIGRFIASFGEDRGGELYILTSENLGPFGTTGVVFQIVPAD